MAVEVQAEYLGDLRVKATHGPSQTTLITDAPVDNQGKGESFSPTDLVATAIATCILTIMGIAAESRGIDLRGATVRTRKEMIADPKRRIASLATTIRVPTPLSERHRKLLEKIAHTCPVHQSLDPRVEAPIRFEWAGEA